MKLVAVVTLPSSKTKFCSRKSKRKITFSCSFDCCIIPWKHLKQLYSNTAIKKIEITKVATIYIMQYQLN